MISSTLFLYLFIFIFTTLCAKFSQQKTIKGTKFKMNMLILAFLTHWFFCAFTNIGVDYHQYVRIIEDDCIWRFLRGEEIGFNGLSYILFKLTSNADVCIFIFKTMALLIFYYGFYLLRNHVQLWLSILAFNVQSYLAGFNIIAMQIAISLVFLSSVLVLVYKSKYLPILLSLIATTFHASCIVMVACFVFILVINYKKKSIGMPMFVMLGLLVIVILLQARSLLTYSISNFDSLNNYERYLEVEESEGSGLFKFFLYAYFLLIIIPIINSKMDSYIKNSILVFYGLCFVFAIMGYIIGLTRLNNYNVTLLYTSIPYIFYEYEIRNIKLKSLFDFKIEKLIFVLYLFFVGFSSLRNASSPMHTNMLYDYTLFNPFQ